MGNYSAFHRWVILCKTHFPRPTPTDTPSSVAAWRLLVVTVKEALTLYTPGGLSCYGCYLTQACAYCCPAQLAWPSQLPGEAVTSPGKDQGDMKDHIPIL